MLSHRSWVQWAQPCTPLQTHNNISKHKNQPFQTKIFCSKTSRELLDTLNLQQYVALMLLQQPVRPHSQKKKKRLTHAENYHRPSRTIHTHTHTHTDTHLRRPAPWFYCFSAPQQQHVLRKAGGQPAPKPRARPCSINSSATIGIISIASARPFPPILPRTSRPLRCHNARADPHFEEVKRFLPHVDAAPARAENHRDAGGGAERSGNFSRTLFWWIRVCASHPRVRISSPKSGAALRVHPGGRERTSGSATRRTAVPTRVPPASYCSPMLLRSGSFFFFSLSAGAGGGGGGGGGGGKKDHPLTDSAILDFCLRVTWSAPASIRGGVSLVEGRGSTGLHWERWVWMCGGGIHNKKPDATLIS